MNIQASKIYTFTFEGGGFLSIFQFRSGDDIKSDLTYYMSENAEILNVHRPLFSGRWVVTFIATRESSLEEYIRAFSYAFNQMDIDMQFVTAEEGGMSSEPGGVIGLPREIGKGAGYVAGSTMGGAFAGLFQSANLPLILGAGVILGVLILTKR